MIISYLYNTTRYQNSLFTKTSAIQINILGLDEFIRDYNEVINSKNRYINVEYFLTLHPEYLPNIKGLLKILTRGNSTLVIMFDNQILKQFQLNSLIGFVGKGLLKFTTYCHNNDIMPEPTSTITIKI